MFHAEGRLVSGRRRTRAQDPAATTGQEPGRVGDCQGRPVRRRGRERHRRELRARAGPGPRENGRVRVPSVQDGVINWFDDDVGFRGWRFDYVMGYARTDVEGVRRELAGQSAPAPALAEKRRSADGTSRGTRTPCARAAATGSTELRDDAGVRAGGKTRVLQERVRKTRFEARGRAQRAARFDRRGRPERARTTFVDFRDLRRIGASATSLTSHRMKAAPPTSDGQARRLAAPSRRTRDSAATRGRRDAGDRARRVCSGRTAEAAGGKNRPSSRMASSSCAPRAEPRATREQQGEDPRRRVGLLRGDTHGTNRNSRVSCDLGTRHRRTTGAGEGKAGTRRSHAREYASCRARRGSSGRREEREVRP